MSKIKKEQPYKFNIGDSIVAHNQLKGFVCDRLTWSEKEMKEYDYIDKYSYELSSRKNTFSANFFNESFVKSCRIVLTEKTLKEIF